MLEEVDQVLLFQKAIQEASRHFESIINSWECGDKKNYTKCEVAKAAQAY